MDTAQDIVNALKAHHNLTDKAIADMAATTQPTIHRIRTGTVANCTSGLYMRLVQARDKLSASTSAAA